MAIIDVVEWVPDSDVTLFAYNHPESNLSTFTQLVVHESQEAVLFTDGQLLGKFGPGRHTLNTANLPILRRLYGFPFGGNNPFKAKVWFVNKIHIFDGEWQTDRMDIHDVDYNTGIPLIARGRYGIQLENAEKFLIKIVGTRSSYSEYDLTRQFYGEFASKLKSMLTMFMMQNSIGIKQISAYLDTMSQHAKGGLNGFWEEIGFELRHFYITSVQVDNTSDEGIRVLEAISRQSAQSIGGYTWQQAQMFEVAKGAIDGVTRSEGGGLLGALLATNMMGGMGSGMAMQPQYSQPNFKAGGAQGQVDGPLVRDVFCSNCSKKYSSRLNYCPNCGDVYMPCPACGADNDEESKRCVTCGAYLEREVRKCKHCGEDIGLDTNFCEKCGKSQSEISCPRCKAPVLSTMKFCPKCGKQM